MRQHVRVIGGSLAVLGIAAVVPLTITTGAQASGRFTGGNVVVYRVGDGSGALSNAAAPVFLDEYSPSGSKVQSVPLPTTAGEGNAPLTAAGLSRSEGLLDRSADGRYLVLTGYDAPVGTTGPTTGSGSTSVTESLTATSPSTVGRVVGLVDGNGVSDTTTVLKGSSVPNVIRSATSTDGERLWATGGNGGVLTTSRGSTGSSVAEGDSTSNLSALTIQGGQLFTSGILNDRLAAIGSGTPTSGTATDLNGLPANLLSYGYAFADLTPAGYDGTALDTLYLANSSSRGGTIDKYRWDGTTWVSAGSVDIPGAFGVVSSVQNNVVALDVTTPTSLVDLTDPDGSSTTFTPTAITTVATAPANTEFRGVALAPTAPSGPSVYLRSPQSGATVQSGQTIPVSAFVGAPDGVTVTGVKVSIAGGTPVAATQSGHVWTASVSTAGLGAGSSTIAVTATDNANATTTSSRTVTISGSSAPPGALTPGSYPWSAKGIVLKGKWVSYRTKSSPSKLGKTTAVRNATAQATTYGRVLTLTFDTKPNAGEVKVTVDGKSSTLNLFARTGKPLVKTWSLGTTDQKHTVLVTVLGKKVAKSTGTAAFLAALKVTG